MTSMDLRRKRGGGYHIPNNCCYMTKDGLCRNAGVWEASPLTGVPMKHATYQIELPIIYLYSFKGKFRVNHMNKMLVAQSDR